MYRWAALLGLIGLAVATGVIVWSGAAEVMQALKSAGFGIVLVAIFHVIPLAISAAGWQVLVPGKRRPSLRHFIYFLWIRAAVNNLMPVARIGGEIASVRMMTAFGMRQSTAIATTVVELTLSIIAVFLFVVMGVVLFGLRIADENIKSQLLWGLLLSLPLLALMALVQRIGFFGLLSRLFKFLFRDKWAAMAGNAARLDRAVAAIYLRKKRSLTCALMQFVSWVAGTGEIWLALYFLGHPVPMVDAFIIEALIQASVSAGFAIPGALGIQEAGFLVFGGMLGLPREIAAALAVIRRCRDILFYAPGLVAWQVFEGKKLFAKSRK